MCHQQSFHRSLGPTPGFQTTCAPQGAPRPRDAGRAQGTAGVGRAGGHWHGSDSEGAQREGGRGAVEEGFSGKPGKLRQGPARNGWTRCRSFHLRSVMSIDSSQKSSIRLAN